MQISYSFLTSAEYLQEADISSISSLLTQLHGRICEVSRSHLESAIQSSQLLIARDMDRGGQIVGLSCLVVYITPTSRQGWIEDVIVEEAYRGHGLGLQLTERLIDAAIDLELQNLFLTSNPRRVAANQLYQRLGFQKRETNFYLLDLSKDIRS